VIRRASLQAASGLFPHLDVTIAYVLLFSVYSGRRRPTWDDGDASERPDH
jgi:hypothetical protein